MEGSTYRVLGKTNCPRCGSKAKVRAERTGGDTDALMVLMRCPGCKLKIVKGFTTEAALELQDEIFHMEELKGSRREHSQAGRRLGKRIEALKRRQAVRELGL